ncbi:glycosyltransferase [Desulfatiglans anilini]|uniref:glycosyltransferase n=1 Tax=Desulfatiglans anilini TaxID=90728 RepID=UPI0003F94095|nr:glycosyltransferase family 2 protein [Desulfatiglans anilini]
MTELAIVIPFVNEYPQIAFTVQNLMCELNGSGIDYKIIAVDNYCQEVAAQGRPADKGGQYMAEIARIQERVTCLSYSDKLSHWNAKMAAVRATDAPFLFFCDGHCILSQGALVGMYRYYEAHHEALHGTLHLPLSYMLERTGRELIYKLVADAEKGVAHYSFSRYRPAEKPYRVPCMSTCGVMITREILVDRLGGWPAELGIYGGGENFLNFCLAVLGYHINIIPGPPLYHYAEKRGYRWNHTDWVRNRCIAAYLHGGRDFAGRFMAYVKGRPEVLSSILDDVVIRCGEQRRHIKSQQVMDIEDWMQHWVNVAPGAA